MNRISDELTEIARQLELVRVQFDSEEVRVPLQKIEESAKKMGKAFSGSWLGYHSRVYYRQFQPPPQGAHCSQEWGLRDVGFGDTVGQWVEYDYDHVRKEIRDRYVPPHHELGNKVFVRHGQSSTWRDVKDFIQDRSDCLGMSLVECP